MTGRARLETGTGADPWRNDGALGSSTRVLEVATASDEELCALHAHVSRQRSERLPDDPPIAREAGIRRIRAWGAMEGMATRIHACWVGRRVVAHARSHVPLRDDNRHPMHVVIEVDRAHRRRGHGRELLQSILEDASEFDRSLLLGSTDARVPAGEGFARAIGARCGLTVHTHQLVLEDLDLALLEKWSRERPLVAEYEFELWSGAIPDEHLDAFCTAASVLNEAPTGDLAVEDVKLTPIDIRRREAHYALREVHSWRLVVWHRPNTSLAGFTEVAWDPAEPHVVHQNSTVVVPAHRGRGLAGHLKRRMLREVLSWRQEARFMRTENADANASMLAINRSLGFRPYAAEAYWQMAREDAARTCW